MKTIALSILMAALALGGSLPGSAQTAASPASPASTATAQPRGQIESAVAVVDPMFGIHANVLGLERRVEILQWRKVDFPAPPHYEQAWSAERIDSAAFDAAHRNAGDLPFNGERWWSSDPKLDGHPVSAQVMSVLDAWTPLRPDLSQLPTNLAVSFQPDGDWLSTSQNPAQPQVGDVRVRWRVIAQALAPSGAVLIAGRWEMPAPVASAATSTATSQGSPPTPSANATREWAQRLFGEHLAWWVGGGLALALVLLAWKRRR
jgi:hypothetical protein